MAASESRDGPGAGDCDRLYVWGQPRELLTIRQQARLIIIRGFVMDTIRGGERRNCATGDIGPLDQTVVRPSGLIVPAKPKE